MNERRQSRVALTVAWSLVVLFYGWTAVSDNVSWRFGQEQTDYYNLLVDGFLDGQLSLKTEVPRALLDAADPYDPEQRPEGVGLHDASLYRGKYYIYYGVAPAALLLLPFRALSGVDLPLKAAVLVSVVVGFSFALALLAGLARAFFPRVGAWKVAALGVAFGICSCTAILVRRGSMYELPIASGFCCAMAGLYGLWRALQAAPGRRVGWLVATGVAWGCAIGSRPTYLLAPLVMLAVVAWADRGDRRGVNLAAMLAPLAVIGAALAWYNYARFGDVKEFGVNYILSAVHEAKVEHFRPRYVGWNLHAYFFAGSEWSREFPFFRGAESAVPRPRQHYGMDISFGLLAHVPFLLLGGLAVLGWRRIEGGARGRWAMMVMAMGGTAVATLGMLLMFYAAMVRYVADFVPALALLAAVGALVAMTRGKRWVTGVVGAVAAVSMAMVLLFTVRVYDRVRGFNPTTYERLERLANALTGAKSERERRGAAMSGPAEGRAVANLPDGVRLRVQFPGGAAGRREPLLVTGEHGRANVLAVEFVGEGRLRFVFEHWGRQAYAGPALAYPRGRDVEVTVRHPLYAPAGARGAVVGEDPLTVEIDGEQVWRVVPLFYPAEVGELFVGVDPIGLSGVERRFAGSISLVPIGK